MAQAFKIPKGGNYPPLHNIVPQWWDTTITTPRSLDEYLVQYDNTETDKERRFRDPRWAGAFKKTFGSGAGGEIDFRALSYQHPGGTTATPDAGKYLYLSWFIKLHPTTTAAYSGSYINVGFRPTTGTPVQCRINLLAAANAGTTNNGSNAGTFFSIDYATYSSGTWSPVAAGSIPAWVRNNTYAWTLGGSITWWAVHMRVPVSPLPDGLDLSGTFGLGLYVESNTDTLAVDNRWPAGLATSPTSVDPATFQNCYLEVAGVSAGDTQLMTGVSLPLDNIGTQGVTAIHHNSDGTTNIISSPQAIYYTAGVPTTFFARPRNDDPTDVVNLTTTPNKSMSARFVLADFGSAIPGGAWRTIGSGTIPTPPATTTTLAAAGGTADIVFVWTPTTTDETFYSAHPHQCIMVDLSTTDPSIIFLNASAARNMDFGSASKFERSAMISVQGLLDSFPLRKRDIFVYVERVNMPVNMDDETRRKYQQARETLETITSAEGEYGAEQRYVSILLGDLRHLRYIDIDGFLQWVQGNIREGLIVITNQLLFTLLRALGVEADNLDQLIERYAPQIRARHKNLQYDDRGQPQFTEVELKIIELLLNNIAYRGQTRPASGELPPVEELEQYLPTVRYYVYHDTGRTVVINGVTRPVVESQPSFGYYMWLDHDVEKWELRLKGAEKLAENLYLIRPPTEGSTTVTTSIHAVQVGEEDQVEPPEVIVPFPEYPRKDESIGCLEMIAQILEKLGPVGRALAQFLRSLGR
jgi:hypothetical protein